MLQLTGTFEADQSSSADLKSTHNFGIRCGVCRWRVLCLPALLEDDEIAALENVIVERRKVKAKEFIYHQDQPFKAIFAILNGAVKRYKVLRNGVVSVTDFHFPGESFGYSGINHGYYPNNAEALQDTLVCVLPFDELEKVCLEIPRLKSRLFHLMSDQIIDHQKHLTQLMGTNSGGTRVAMFLLDLFSRSARRGESATRIRLPMTRHDMGNYLGLTTESVSRELTRLVRCGAIIKNGRDITIRDFETLRRSICLVKNSGSGLSTGSDC